MVPTVIDAPIRSWKSNRREPAFYSAVAVPATENLTIILPAVTTERFARAKGEGRLLIRAREKNILQAVTTERFARAKGKGRLLIHAREKNKTIFETCWPVGGGKSSVFSCGKSSDQKQ